MGFVPSRAFYIQLKKKNPTIGVHLSLFHFTNSLIYPLKLEIIV